MTRPRVNTRGIAASFLCALFTQPGAPFRAPVCSVTTENHPMRTTILTALVAGVVFVAGCGGGGGSSNLQVVGSQQAEIDPNSIVFGDIVVSALGQIERLSDVNCASDLSVCSVTYNGFRRTIPIDSSDDSEASGTAYTPFETWEYVSVTALYAELDGADMKFGLTEGVRYPNSLPTGGSASWSGEMVALDGNNRLVRGKAVLEIEDLRLPRVDVTLSPRGYPAMAWTGIPLVNGRFSERRSAGDYIKGELYGPAVEESGGVFERNHLVGAFGAARE